MYVFGGDKSDVGSVYIYDFAGNSWSKQTTTGAPASLSNSRSSAILDHDTNVIFTLPGGGKSMYMLSLNSVTNKANGSSEWTEVGTPSFSTDGAVTAALANNHINYFGVPGTAAGSANIFVIHFSYFQPEAQAYPTLNGGATFPDQAGQAVSFPTEGNTSPQSMLFVPDDFSQSYVVTHWTNLGDYNSQDNRPMAAELVNSTQILPAPESKDKAASYACSPTDCAQIDSEGNLYFIQNALGTDFAVSSSAAWSKSSYSVSGSGSFSTNSTDVSPSGSAAASGASGASATGTKTGSSGASGSAVSPTASSASSNAATALNGNVVGALFGAFAVAVASLI
jgi:hypothetical protein